MNESAVKTALRDLISSNEAVLTLGLVHQGKQRSFAQVTRSNLTPPAGYYYIIIMIPSSVERSSARSRTQVRNPVREAVYQVQVEIYDEANMDQDFDDEVYEHMHLDFDTLTDRVIKLVRDQEWISASERLKLVRSPDNTDRTITKQSVSGTWGDTETAEVAMLGCRITFALVGECLDDTDLYP